MGTSTSTSDEFSRPADTMRERIGEGHIKLWVVMTGNRWIVTGVILVASYILFLLLNLVGGGSTQKLVTTSAVTSAFGSFIIATVTAVTLVLSIGQFVLSQEIGPLGKQRQRMQTATDFRTDVEESGNVGVSPTRPATFLQTLIQMVEARANRLSESVSESSTPDEITTYADGIIEHSETIAADLDGEEFGSFRVLLPVLNYNYSWKIAAARNLRGKHSDELSEEADEAFADLIEALRFFGPAREHFKTLYFQWEIVNVSQAMLYAAMPGLVLAGYMIFVFEATTSPSTVFGFSPAFLAVSALYIIGLVPFAVLLSYLLRILTVAKRTLAIGPFILRKTEELESVRTTEEPE